MKRTISPPQNEQRMSFAELYDEINGHWKEKARRLQRRRWRHIEHERRWRRYKDNEFIKYQFINTPERRRP